MWSNVGSQKPLVPTKRKVSTEPLSPTVVDKRVAQMEPHMNKRHTQLQPTGNKSGPQRVQTAKSKSATQESEAVRSKMRETLAAALSVGIQNQEKASNEDNNSPSEAGKAHVDSQPTESTTTTVEKFEDCETSASKNVQNRNNDVQEPQYNYVMPDADGSFGDAFFVKDELLQGNGLSWAWDMEQVQIDEKSNDEVKHGQNGEIDANANETDNIAKSPEELASRIEAELFKFFGGVNKKYKEKGRSLMFNLKDCKNPELREKVLSGVISPERLCSMTPEELASKELSEWRMAKAEELDKMIVLPDVDIRRLVKKTHKGEYQVEVEQDDAVSVEVSVGGSSSFSHFQPKKKKSQEVKEKEIIDGDKVSSENLTIPADGTDFMQELIVDEFKDEGFLPPIVSLDEFMESLNTEPPFENLSVDSKESKPLVEKVNSETGGQTDSEKVPVKPTSAEPQVVDQPKAKTMEGLSGMKSNDTLIERKPMPASSAVIGEHVWEGELQLMISSSVSSIGLFRSGEKTSTKEWPGSMEIKGRVRLDAFEKFLQELPMSRTRAVMVVHFVLKDSSSEIHRALLSEAVDSYIEDERLGFGEPIPGVELYFCPPHTKIIEMLCRHLSKSQNDILKSNDNGLIGVVVWRRPHITFNNPTSSQHKRHKTHNFPTRRHETINSNTNFNHTAKPVNNNKLTAQPNNNNDDDEDDDIPPGFGPGVGATAARDEDDLPEFNFSGNTNSSGQTNPARGGFGSKVAHSNPNASRPVDQMRQLIYKYGQTASGVDEDDDMPEWQPQINRNHQQPLMPHMVNQNRAPPIGQVMRPHMNIQPHVNVMQNVVRWPPPPLQPPGHHFPPPNAAVPGQHYGGQWRQDAPRSRGF